MAANDCRTVRSRQVRQRGALLADCRLSWHHFSGRLNDCCCAKLSVRFRLPFCFWEQDNMKMAKACVRYDNDGFPNQPPYLPLNTPQDTLANYPVRAMAPSG